MNQPCDCCKGPHVSTPSAIFNRPGLSVLAYRAGTYGSFRETMQARLASAAYPALSGLNTRDLDDPTMALIDAWAVVGDVLTFYQERLANEGYLRTATERRSVLELARLVGYTPRPGVAAGVYLAYLLENDAAPVEIPAGAKSNSIPAPGEQMQAFETSEALPARVEWNTLEPRLSAPLLELPQAGGSFYLKGIATGLKPNDPLLLGTACAENWQLHFVAAIEPDNENDRTKIVLRTIPAVEVRPAAATGAQSTSAGAAENDGTQKIVVPTDRGVACEQYDPATGEQIVPRKRADVLNGMVDALGKEPGIQPAGAKQLPRNARNVLAKSADGVPRLLTALRPRLSDTLYTAWNSIAPETQSKIRVYAMRVDARPFGHNAPLRQIKFDPTTGRTELADWMISDPWNAPPAEANEAEKAPQPDGHEPSKLLLDNDYDIAPDSFIVVQKQDRLIVTQATKLVQRSAIAYGLSGKTVEVDLPADKTWLSGDDAFSAVRDTRVFAASEELELAEMPVADDVSGAEIELKGLYDGLQPGRWLIVAGQRSDVAPGANAAAAELVMLAGVDQRTSTRNGVELPDEKVHTFIGLANTGLAFRYRRETVTIYGNVVHATHGETREQTLGSGDAAKVYQTFGLEQAPLTFVSAPTVSGVESTLRVWVNDVQWHEALSPSYPGNDRGFVTRTDDGGKTSVVFGDGEHGARLPTGIGNVRATYRSGMGKAGNVKAGQISLLNTRPIGAKDVLNPLPASGGADPQERDSIRRTAPLALRALDRLVSVSDYADFSLTFAGVGKAVACRIADDRRRLVEVTIAGLDDIPIDTTSDLYRNLRDALQRFGDPYLSIRLAVRKRAALVIALNVKIDPDYRWDVVEPMVRAAMLDRFGFANTELGQAILLSDVFVAVQGVRGVVYVDVDVFAKVSDDDLVGQFTAGNLVTLGRSDCIGVDPGEIAYLVPEVPDTLILQEVKP